MQPTLTSNTYAYLVQLCEYNGLNLNRMAKNADVSQQVLSTWKKNDPQTIVSLNALLREIDREARAKRNCFEQTDEFNAGSLVRMYSGTYVNVFDPKPEMFLASDIAEGIAYCYRWRGQSKSKRTVAEHSCRVANRAENDNDYIAGGFHDASEGVLADLASPIKKNMELYRAIESGVMRVIAQKFGFEWPLSAAVKRYDYEELGFEWDNCMLTANSPSLLPEEAKELWLSMFGKYGS